MENDLISRHDLLERINTVLSDLVIQGKLYSYEVYDTIISLIDVAPAVDAEPVQHGRWEHGMQCSFCKQIDTTKPNYCPNCGTRMDGDKYATD